jgi:Zn finger protein HypA/HybF involved in hydrogenase expression
MHESGLVRDVLDHAEQIALRDGGRLSYVSLRVGAAAGTSAEAVRRHAEVVADELWGYRPVFEVVASDDPMDWGAHGLALVAVRLED